MFYTIKSIIPLIVSVLITFLCFHYNKNLIEKKKFIKIFSFLWIFVFLIQYFILGENSPITYRDNADQGLSRILHDINFHLGGSFAHNIYGGTDYYGVSGQLAGLFVLERFIFSIFPIWIGILVHKFSLIFVCFLGAYFLLSRAFNFNKINSIYAASLLSVINPWATYNSIQHGIGYAVIYLAIYVYLYTSANKHFFIYSTLLSLLIASSITPFHSALTLFVGLLCTGFLKKPSNIKSSLISIIILLMFIIINWSENIFGVYTFGQLTSRVLSDTNLSDYLGGFYYLHNKTNYCFIDCSIKYSPIFIIFFLASLILFINFKKENLKILFFIIFIAYIPNIIWFAINLLGFTTLNSMNFYYMSYYLLLPITYFALKVSEKQKNFLKYFSLIFLFFSVSIMGHDKINFIRKIFYEPQSKLFKIQNLKEKEWKKIEHARTSTLFPLKEFHPNFAWAYGFETSDGWTHFIAKNYQYFWDYGVLKKDFRKDEYMYGANLYTNNLKMIEAIHKDKELIINNFLDLNLLGLINNNYIFSYIPVKGKGLKQVSGPNKEPYENLFNKKRDFAFYFDDIKNRANYLKKPPDIYIYEIQNASDRVFFPTKILKIDNDNLSDKYKFISKNYEKNISYSPQEGLKPGEGKILNTEKIKNGYKITTEIKSRGMIVLNSFFLPYWKVYINGKEQDIINLADIHMGVELKKGLNEVKFLYERKMLKDLIKDYIMKLLDILQEN